MEKYVALLRGVNVGGKNKVAMPLLKAAFEQAGFVEVKTYINSGNVVFSSEPGNAEELQRICREAIASTFDLDVPVAVVSASDLIEALDHAPAWWGIDPDSKHNAIVVIAPADPAEVIASVGEAKPDYEQVACYGRVIFWSAPLATFSHTRWSKVVSSKAYGSITIRNANTARKLAQLAE